MATLRKWLDRNGFDWATGRIIYQPVDGYDEEQPSWGTSPGWEHPSGAREIAPDDPLLDLEFDTSYGGPQAPRFIAADGERLYFPAQYDGSTWCETVYRDITRYLNWREYETPYPGV
jgi:hypothetical protein